MSDDRKQQRQEENNTTSSFKSTISSPSVTGVPKLDVSSQVAIAKQSVNLVSQHAIDLAVEQRPLLISGLELNKSAGKVTVGENCVNVNGWSRVSDVEQSLTGKDNNIANVVFTHDGHLVHYIKSENGVQGEQVLDNHSSYRLIMHQPTWQHSDPVDLGKDTPKESGRSVNMHTEAAAPWCPKLWYVNPSVSHENNLVQTPDTQHWNSIDHQSSTSSELPSKKLHLDSPVSFGDLPKTHDNMLHVCEGNSNVMVDTQPAWREAPKLDCDSESNEGPSHSPGHDNSQDIIATLGAELQDRVSAEVGRYTKSVKQILECLEPTSKNYQYTMLSPEVEIEIHHYQYLLRLHQEAAKLTRLIIGGPTTKESHESPPDHQGIPNNSNSHFAGPFEFNGI